MSFNDNVAEGLKLRRSVKECAARWLSANNWRPEVARRDFKEANEAWERWVARNIDALLDHAEQSSERGAGTHTPRVYWKG